MEQTYKLSLVIPVYNEEENIPLLLIRLKKIIEELGCSYEFIFVMDPSKDRTEEVILQHRQQDKNIKLLKMSRRFGQPTCSYAGIIYSTGDICVVIDADLQDPPELIKDMVKKWQEGFDVVYAQRSTRDGETLMKRFVSWIGYWIINKITDIKIPRNTGDFRLMSRRVINELKRFKEHDAFLRGLVAYVGFNQTAIQYQRDARLKGTSKYNQLFGSLRIGLNGVFSFSKYPLHIISVLGGIISLLSFLLAFIYILFSFLKINIPWGNPTLVILLSFFSGIQLLSIGIIGQYFARIFDEVKQRPTFIVQERHGFENIKDTQGNP